MHQPAADAGPPELLDHLLLLRPEHVPRDPLTVLLVDVGQLDRRGRDGRVVLPDRLRERRLAARVIGVRPQPSEQGRQGDVHGTAYVVGVLTEPSGDLVDGQGGAQVVEVGH